MIRPEPRNPSAYRPSQWVAVLVLAMSLSLAILAMPACAQSNSEEETETNSAPTTIEINPEEETHDHAQSTAIMTGQPTREPVQVMPAINAFDPTLTPVPLLDRLTPAVIELVFQGVERVALVADDGPIAAAAFVGDEMVGYIFSTFDVLRAPGYSSTPFDVIAGIDMDGKITGAALLFHREPYLLNDRARTGRMVQYLMSLQGVEGRIGAAGSLEPSYVAGATISARAMRNAVQEGARMVLRYRTEEIVINEPTIDTFNFKPLSINELVANGALAQAHITNADLRAVMTKAGLGDLLPEMPMHGGPDDTYIDFVVGYGNPPTVGRNGAGPESFEALVNDKPAGINAIFVGSVGGAYDHRGTKFNNLSNDFRLDRVMISQDGHDVYFSKAEAIMSTRTIADLLILPADSGFDPMEPWTAQIFASGLRPDGTKVPFLLAELTYTLPSQLILMPDTSSAMAWVEPWVEGKRDIAILGVALIVLTLILGFQHKLARNRLLHRYVRTGFLLFTLFWIGWTASAQLSIVHLLNYIKAPFDHLDYAFYLAEPLIVMISIYTLISLVLLGRGVFCGWLCPFGALQELLAQVARALGLPQWNPSEKIQRKLWLVKYGLVALIIVLTFAAPSIGAKVEEVEPFKTAITAVFVRGLPYVIYATILLLIGLFTERAYCRFLCPLGAGLAVLDRLHLIDMLKRRPECGSPCHLCERSCPVRAIESSGKIIMSECFQCLDCQVEYHDDHRCPPLAQARKRRERGSVPDLTFGLRMPEKA